MNETGIIWSERTWNPMSGCQKVSQGCKFCYAEALSESKRGTPAFPNGFDLTIRPHKLKEPFKEKKPTLIFVNSMSDLFWEKVSDEYRDRIIDVMEQTPQHEYQVLTKRPEEMLRYSLRRALPPNFWAGVSVENESVLHRIDTLRKVKAEIHFISAEPLLGPMPTLNLEDIEWVITGGESGFHLKRPDIQKERSLATQLASGKWIVREDRIDWVREIRDACIKNGTSFFHKQWGGTTPHSAGRTLDGRTWDEFPRLPSSNTVSTNKHLLPILQPESDLFA